MTILMTLDDAATALAVSRRTVERLTAAGRLPVVRIGAATRVRQADLDAFVEEAAAVPRVPTSPTARVIPAPRRRR